MVGELFAEVLLGVEDDLPLHKFDRGGRGLGADDEGHGVDRVPQAREGHEQADGALRQRQQLEDDLGDHAEGPLRADDQILHRIARAVLDDLAAERDDLPVRQHDLQPAHIVAGDAVLDGAHAARVGADVTADRGGFFARVGRVEKALLLDIGVDLHEQHARLYGQSQIVLVELEEAVHEAHVEQDAALRGDRRADETGARAARGDGDVLTGGVAHDGGHLLRREHPQHDVGIVDGSAQLVVAVVLVDFLPRKDALVVPDQLPQGGDIRRGHLLIAHTSTPLAALIRSMRRGTIS